MDSYLIVSMVNLCHSGSSSLQVTDPFLHGVLDWFPHILQIVCYTR